MLYKFNILFLLSCLNNKIMSINSLSSSSIIQHTINNSSTYVAIYEHFEFIFVAFSTLVNTYFDKIITSGFTQISQSCEVCTFMQTLSIVLSIFAYYAGILHMLNVLLSYYTQDYAGIIGSSLPMLTPWLELYLVCHTCVYINAFSTACPLMHVSN